MPSFNNDSPSMIVDNCLETPIMEECACLERKLYKTISWHTQLIKKHAKVLQVDLCKKGPYHTANFCWLSFFWKHSSFTICGKKLYQTFTICGKKLYKQGVVKKKVFMKIRDQKNTSVFTVLTNLSEKKIMNSGCIKNLWIWMH